MIWVYCTDTWKLAFKLSGHSGSVIALDWSQDSKYIRTNDTSYEILYWNVEEKKQDPSGRSNCKDTEWATCTAKLGWNLQGIFPKGCDNTHINAVARSQDGALLACGDDWGLITLFNNPTGKGSRPRSFRGHSEHVTNVMFSADDMRMWSAGGYDQTLMQWARQ